jgi:hypothetical protein
MLAAVRKRGIIVTEHGSALTGKNLDVSNGEICRSVTGAIAVIDIAREVRYFESDWSH